MMQTCRASSALVQGCRFNSQWCSSRNHGAATPHAVPLARAVRPEVALISVGAGNRYGHPTPDTLAALGGITTFRTDRDGTVEVSLDGPGLVVRAHANGLPPPRRGFVPYAPTGR